MSYRSFILLGILINILTSCTNKKGLPESKAFEYVVTYYSDSTIKEIVQKRKIYLIESLSTNLFFVKEN